MIAWGPFQTPQLCDSVISILLDSDNSIAPQVSELEISNGMWGTSVSFVSKECSTSTCLSEIFTEYKSKHDLNIFWLGTHYLSS